MDQKFTMETILFLTLYGGVTLIAIYDCCYLLLRRYNAFHSDIKPPLRLRRWTAAFFAAMATSHVWWLMLYPEFPIDTYSSMAILCTGLDLITIFPIILCTMLAMLQDRQRPLWPIAIILAVALIDLLLFSIFGIKATSFHLTVSLGILLVIIIIMVRAVRQYGHWLRENYADLEHKEVWQNFLVLAVFMVSSITYNVVSKTYLWEICMQLLDLALIIVMLWRVEMLQTLEKPDDEPTDISVSMDNAASMDPLFKKIELLLQEHCVENQFYLNHDISLAQLATLIGTNTTYLSRYFAHQGLTYNAYINGLRINYFIHHYQESNASNRFVTARQLARESGFRSYSTFSTAFRQIKGQALTEWTKQNGMS